MAVLVSTYLTDKGESKKLAACLRRKLPPRSKVTVTAKGYIKVYAASGRARDVKPLRAAMQRAEGPCKL